MPRAALEHGVNGPRPPGPRSRFHLGHILAIRRNVLGFLTKLAEEYGDIVWFRAGPTRVVFLNHPDYIREVLHTQHHNFVKGRPLHLAKRLLGEGLLTSEGDYHAHQSRTIQPAFHAARVQSYGTAMADLATRLSAEWIEGSTRDMMQDMTDLSTAIVGKTLFHWDVDTATARGIAKAHNDAASLFSRASIPFAELLLRFPLPSSRRFHRAKAYLDSVIYELIAERRRDGRDREDLLSMLLAAQGAENARGMTDVQVRDEALTLLLTALDTTSLALTWTWYALAEHEPVEAQLHAELADVLGGRAPTVDDIARLEYTRMVFLESMRMFPPIYAIARQALNTFSIGGYTVPAGTLVLMSPYVMHRDQRYYAHPDRFDPNRWNGRATSGSSKFTYFPFGGGPRGCIGQSYAMQEAVLVIAALAKDWRMRLAPGHRVEFRPLINLRPKHGMRMVLERRR